PWLGSSVRLGEYVHAANGLSIEWTTGRVVPQPAPFWRSAASGGQQGRGIAQSYLRMTMTCADGRLYHRTGNNVVTLSAVTAEGIYVKCGEFTARQVSNEPTWTFPVISGGKLYLRDQDALLCYDVADRKARHARGPEPIFV